MHPNLLLQQTLSITSIDADGKHFDKVSRIVGETEEHLLEIKLDINTDLFPVSEGEKYEIGIINAEEIKQESSNDLGEDQEGSIIDEYDYVMNGKVFKYELHDEGNISQF
jgi:DNA-directed RNA polymerase I, II, and III subunit RPABC3